MRRITLADVELEEEIKEGNEVRNNQTTFQPQQQYQYQQPQQQNPFQTDTKYEFMLAAMNPFVALIYQIFKGLSWLISRNKR